MTIPVSIAELNSLAVEVYDQGNIPLNDPDASLTQYAIEGFCKHYPGGIMGDGAMRALRRINRAWLVKAGKRVVFRHGHDIAYEGNVGDLDYEARTMQSVRVPLLGATENFLMRTPIRRRFADNRVTEDIWVWDTAAPGVDKATPDRTARLKVVTKNVQWASTDYVQFIYKQPTNHTVRRIKGSYQLQEGAQQWKLEIYRSTDGSAWTLEVAIAAASGTSTFDRTMSVATQYVAIRFSNDSGGNQTPAADGTILGEVYNLMVYATIGSLTADITMETVARWIASVGSTISPYLLNADVQYIQSPSTALTVEPFLWDRWAPIADLINEIVGYGDGDLGRWSWSLLDSERAATPNGLPVLSLDPYPATTSYDYTIDYRDSNLLAQPQMRRAVTPVFNWIPVSYTDQDGATQWVTPNDDASLLDQDSIDDIGGISAPPGGLDVGELGAAAALSFGKRFKVTYSVKRWILVSPLEVSGYIKSAQGDLVPACMIEPMKTVRVTGGPADEDGDPPVFVTTGTDYRHKPAYSCAIATGSPLGPLLPRMAAILAGASAPDAAGVPGSWSGGSGSGSSGGGRGGYKGEADLNFYKRKSWKAYQKAGGVGGKKTWREKKAISKWFRGDRPKKRVPK